MAGITWDANWAALDSAVNLPPDTTTKIGSAVSLGGKVASLLSMVVSYNAAAAKGCDVIIRGENADAAYLSAKGIAWTIPMPDQDGTTDGRDRVISVDPARYPSYEVYVRNNDTTYAATLTSAKTKTATVA